MRQGLGKKLLTLFLGAIVCLFALQLPAQADGGDAAHGAQIFAANCAACHINGGNVVNGQKTLKKEALTSYLKDFSDKGADAIAYQVTNGKAAMPAFKGRLSDKDIADVAAYVFDKAEKGW
ncbi:MAG: cytochrome c6 PetJ [Microcoleaceae cyanobacterium]